MNQSSIKVKKNLIQVIVTLPIPISFNLFLAVLVFLTGCSASKMSLEEARNVSLSSSKKTMEPPPRRIDDIVDVLSHYTESDNSKANEYRKMLVSNPPKNLSDYEMSSYYLKIAMAAAQVGDHNSALKYIRIAYDYDKKDGKLDTNILGRRAAYEEWAGGNYKAGIELWNKVLSMSDDIYSMRMTVEMYLRAGDIKSAEKITKNAKNIFINRDGNWIKTHLASMNALIFDATGKHDEAGEEWVTAIKTIEDFKKKEIVLPYMTKRNFIYNLINRKNYSLAEVEVRNLLKETVEARGKYSNACSQTLAQYGEILLNQGRIEEAESIIKIASESRKIWNIENDIWSLEFYKILIDIFCAKNEFSHAIDIFDISTKNFDAEGYIFNRFFAKSKNLPIALLFSGRSEEAVRIIDKKLNTYSEDIGADHIHAVELKLLRGIAQIKNGNHSEGYRIYQSCIDRFLFARSEYSNSFSDKQRFRQILEAYLSFFAGIHKTRPETEIGTDASLEAFKLVEVLRQQSVQQALSASAARMAVQNAELAELVRQEQDNGRMIAVLDRMLINHISMSPDQQDPRVVSDLKVQISTLTSARSTLLAEIKQKYPDYENLINPKPADYQTVARCIRPHETLISLYPTAERSYLWAINDKGAVEFVALPVGAKQIAANVHELRRSLDLSCDKLGEIPEFDLKLSRWFYQTFLEPVKGSWTAKKDLLIVADGPLGSLPFSVLTTQPHTLSKNPDLLFSDYRQAPWLVRQVALTRLPSVSALIGLRSLPPGDPGRKAFAGFGDPIFNLSQIQQPAELSASMAKRGAQFQIRGVRVTQQGAIDQSNLVSNRLSMLNRLPDTAEELLSVSQSLKADHEQDLFLGPKATEQMVRRIDLSNRRVVYFATHALVPGDIDGLHEPALALCSPEVAGGDEDGLLTAGEIMTLKLNADWVILSACNTGAAAGEGAEAISGLGRAFFYAGTRALLVSLWPVETSSARLLTTHLFEVQNAIPGLSRTAALRDSMLQLIDGPGMKDKTSGRTIASYAHPFFWAAFIIVGDN